MSQVENARADVSVALTRPDNLTALVFTAIQDMIVDASLAPGLPVSEAMLAARLEVSKTPVREALLRLRHIGLVEPTTRGLRVIESSAKRVRDAFEFRAGAEAVAGRYAAERTGVADQARIVELAAVSADAARQGRVEAFLTCDVDFHGAIAHASGNDVLEQSLENSFVLTQVLRRRDVHLDRDYVTDAEEHVAIAEAIQARDGDLAGARLSGHMLRIMAQLLAAHAATSTETTPAAAVLGG